MGRFRVGDRVARISPRTGKPQVGTVRLVLPATDLDDYRVTFAQGDDARAMTRLKDNDLVGVDCAICKTRTPAKFNRGGREMCSKHARMHELLMSVMDEVQFND